MKKTALITGATSGIGIELAHIFAQKGHDIFITGRNENNLTTLKNQLEKTYAIQVYILGKDLAEPNAALDIFNFTQSKGLKIDYLINNAGFGDFGFFDSSRWETIQNMIQVNITALTQLTRLYIDELKINKGKILNVASTAAFQPGPLMAVYFATKAYVLHFTEAIANELKDHGVTVTALCPGPTKSNFFNRANMLQSGLIKGRKLPEAKEVAQYGYQAMMKGKMVAIHGFTNKLLVFSLRLAPRKLVVKMVRALQSAA